MLAGLAWIADCAVLRRYLSTSKAANRRRKGRDGPPTTPSSLAVLHPTLVLFCPAEARARCLLRHQKPLKQPLLNQPDHRKLRITTLPCPFTTATHRLGLKPGFEMNECCPDWLDSCCTAHEHTVHQRGYAHVAVPRAEFIHSLRANSQHLHLHLHLHLLLQRLDRQTDRHKVNLAAVHMRPRNVRRRNSCNPRTL